MLLEFQTEIKMAVSTTLYLIFASLFCYSLAQLSGGSGGDFSDSVSGQSTNWILINKIIEMGERMDQFEQEMKRMKSDILYLQDKLNAGQVAGQWGPWGPMSACSRTCQTYGNQTSGISSRSRSCDSPAPSNGGQCQGNGTEYINCVPDALCPMSVAPLNPSDAIGGNGGWPFSDSDLWTNKPVTGIRMQCGRVLVSMQLKYGDNWGPVWGGAVSQWCEFPATYDVEADFEPDEYVTGVNATHNTYINSVTLQTNKRALRTCGTTTGNTIKDIQGNRMLYISGQKGCYIDRLNLHWAA
ncbi:hypothetical protein FSP39_022444 [Pinctada imbricata]|uniref:Jacalin-type lectin domain-containing protein n=1 Tax=Pinctada imbricata TaxID=66713 RepID=A0AA88YLP1_PINIB|nr:hypothetical protein FSP39_022444 [Pinctada imbricata]